MVIAAVARFALFRRDCSGRPLHFGFVSSLHLYLAFAKVVHITIPRLQFFWPEVIQPPRAIPSQVVKHDRPVAVRGRAGLHRPRGGRRGSPNMVVCEGVSIF